MPAATRRGTGETMLSLRVSSLGATGLVSAIAAGAFALPAPRSSHREAPFITEHPKVDATDFYLFNSYEPGRSGFVTIVANYLPLPPAYGRPNCFSLDPNVPFQIPVA